MRPEADQTRLKARQTRGLEGEGSGCPTNASDRGLSRWVGLSFDPIATAQGTRTNLTEIIEGINPRLMAVTPVNGNRIPSDRLDRRRMDILRKHFRLDDPLARPFLNTTRALTPEAQIDILEHTFVFVLPDNSNPLSVQPLDFNRNSFHKDQCIEKPVRMQEMDAPRGVYHRSWATGRHVVSVRQGLRIDLGSDNVLPSF